MYEKFRATKVRREEEPQKSEFEQENTDQGTRNVEGLTTNFARIARIGFSVQ
jgi:hypothetical protein